MTRRFLSAPSALVSLSLLLALATPLGAAEKEHARAELIARNKAWGPGENRVAVRLTPDPGWHVYWINPGDSGQTTEIDWALPPGATAGPIDWPTPHSFRFGSLISYGYSEEALHLVTLKMPQTAATQPVKAEVSWLVCSEACIPGSASLELELPWSAEPQRDERHAKAFAAAENAVPAPAPADWKASYAARGEQLELRIEGPREGGKAEFFPEANDLIDHSSPQQAAFAGGELKFTQKLSPYFQSLPAELPGVVVLHHGAASTAYRILARPAASN
jgi:DsbC/DsbD-like thiol-disulfide interchange protein